MHAKREIRQKHIVRERKTPVSIQIGPRVWVSGVCGAPRLGSGLWACKGAIGVVHGVFWADFFGKCTLTERLGRNTLDRKSVV